MGKDVEKIVKGIYENVYQMLEIINDPSVTDSIDNIMQHGFTGNISDRMRINEEDYFSQDAKDLIKKVQEVSREYCGHKGSRAYSNLFYKQLKARKIT